jgi:hypothetical protein
LAWLVWSYFRIFPFRSLRLPVFLISFVKVPGFHKATTLLLRRADNMLCGFSIITPNSSPRYFPVQEKKWSTDTFCYVEPLFSPELPFDSLRIYLPHALIVCFIYLKHHTSWCAGVLQEQHGQLWGHNVWQYCY